MPRFGSLDYTVDREATALAYSQAERGGADTCTCNGCRNFRLARAQAFPAEFVALLESLGVDPRKDGEVCHYGRVTSGQHVYDGWFHFVGTVKDRESFGAVDFGNGFSAWMCESFAPRLPSLKGAQVVQIGFSAEAVPWLLDEPEAE
jgi:hypothetical protein